MGSLTRTILVAISVVITIAAYSQNGTKDSLYKLLLTEKADTSKAKLYNAIGDLYEYSNSDSALIYFHSALQLANKLKYQTGILKATRNLTGAHLVANKFDSSLVYAKMSYDYASEFKDSLGIGIALFNIGTAYRFLAEMDSAVKYSLQGARILDVLGELSIAAQLNDGLQVLYMTMGQYDKAIAYGEKAVQQGRELKNNNLLSISLNNLALSYMEIDSLQDKAIDALKESIVASQLSNNISAQAAAYNNLSGIAINQLKFDEAEGYARKSLKVNEQFGSDESAAIALRALAICFLQKKDFVKAKVYVDSSMRLSERTNNTAEVGQNLRIQTILAYASGDLVAGAKYFKQAEKIFATVFNKTLVDKEAELRIKFETEKKELQISSLEADKKVQELTIGKKNTLNLILIGGSIALGVIFLLFYRGYRQKQKIQQQRINELETEKKLAATEAVLKGEEQERTRLAKDLHDGLGGMLSGIKYSLNTMKGNLIMTPENAQAFERSMDMLDSSIKEMRRVAHNMMPEALVKFGLDAALRDFCNDINQSGALKLSYQSIGMEGAVIDQTTSITLFRIVQELLNNAIKHAKAKSAIVQLSKSGEQLAVTVEDDGIGFDTSILKASRGIGWSNIQSRIDYMKGKLDIKSDPGHGTSVHIEFPTQNE